MLVLLSMQVAMAITPSGRSYISQTSSFSINIETGSVTGMLCSLAVYYTCKSADT